MTIKPEKFFDFCFDTNEKKVECFLIYSTGVNEEKYFPVHWTFSPFQPSAINQRKQKKFARR